MTPVQFLFIISSHMRMVSAKEKKYYIDEVRSYWLKYSPHAVEDGILGKVEGMAPLAITLTWCLSIYVWKSYDMKCYYKIRYSSDSMNRNLSISYTYLYTYIDTMLEPRMNSVS